MSKSYNVFNNNDLGYAETRINNVNVLIDNGAIILYDSRIDEPRAVFSLRDFSIMEVTE